MIRSVLLVGLLVAFCQGYETQQVVQMPEAGALLDSDEGLFSQVQSLQRNVTELWTYIHSLRNAVTQHLNHLRQHQVDLEQTVHKLEHAEGGSHAAHTDAHSHSGEHHSHSGEHHSHSGEHHSHSGEHHSHSGEHHSHGGGSDDHQHSHSGEHHSHSGGDDHHHESHSHTSGAHTDGTHQHGDTHESEDITQQSQQGADPLPLVSPVQRQGHSHHSHSQSHSQSGASSPSAFKPLQLMTEQGHHHHHHHNPPTPGPARNLTRMAAVVIPKYSEYGLYDFAVCNVKPNRAIPEDQQQNIMGQINLWQKKMGGPLNIHMNVQGFAMGGHQHGGQQVLQTAHAAHQQEEEDSETTPMSHKHGFHIHTSGDLNNGCQSTGPHFNPKMVNHGAPNALVRHVGDLGNIECDEHGIANLIFSDSVASLRGQYSIIGKSMVIHANEDDIGLGGDEESTKTGNAGTRIACCTIQKIDKLPIRSYKAMKSAIPRP